MLFAILKHKSGLVDGWNQANAFSWNIVFGSGNDDAKTIKLLQNTKFDTY